MPRLFAIAVCLLALGSLEECRSEEVVVQNATGGVFEFRYCYNFVRDPVKLMKLKDGQSAVFKNSEFGAFPMEVKKENDQLMYRSTWILFPKLSPYTFRFVDGYPQLYDKDGKKVQGSVR